MFKTCPICLEGFLGMGKYCSVSCEDVAKAIELKRLPPTPPPTTISKECEWCGLEFQTVRANVMYCSRPCRSKALEENDKTVKPCAICKKPSLPGGAICSPQCAVELTRRAKERWEAKRPTKKRAVNCNNCGKEFEGDVNRKYCSLACVFAARARNQKTNKTHSCKVCGEVYESYEEGSKFCSRACFGKSRIKKENPKEVVWIECLFCKTKIVRDMVTRKYCSRRCEAKYRRMLAKQNRLK